MAEGDINAGMNIDPSGWSAGLNKAQEDAAKFIAFMGKIDAVFQRVANKSLDTAGAINAIGAVSASVREEIELLAQGGTTLSAIQGQFGTGAAAVEANARAILAGNETLDNSLKKLDLTFKEGVVGVNQYMNARKELERMIAATKAKAAPSEMRSAEDLVTKKPVKRASADILATKDIDALEEMGLLNQARRYRKLQQMAELGGVSVPKFSLGFGEDSAQANMRKIAAAMDIVRDKVQKLKRIKDDAQAAEDAALKRTLAGIKEEEAYRLKLIKMIQREKAEKLAAMKVVADRQMSQMYVSMPDSVAKQYITKPSSDIFGGIFAKGGKLESKFIQNAFQGIERGSQMAAKGVMSLVRSLTNAGSSMAFMTASISGLFAIVTGASVGAIFKMAKDFEHSMAKIMILVKEGESTLPRLTNQVKEFSKAFGMSPMASAEGFRIAISSDVPPQEITKFMEEAGKLAVTHSTTIEKTADMMSMMRNAFNLTTKDLSRLRDMIFVMTDRGRVEVDQFAGEIGKISSVAATAGVNMQEMLAGFAALSRTKGPEQAGTMLINLFKLIGKQGPEAQKILKDLQITLSPEQTKAEGLIKQIEKIHDALQKNPAIVEQITDDFRELRAWGEITGSQFEALKSIMEDMYNSVGEGDKHFNEMMNTTEVRWNRLMAQMKISAMEMGIAVMQSFNEWIDASGGVEAAQLKISQGFKRIELAARYMLGVIEFVGTGVMAIMSGIATVVYTVWKGFEIGAKMVKGMFLSLKEKSVLGDLKSANDEVYRLKTQLGSRDEPVLKKQLEEATEKARKLQEQLTGIHDEQREGVSALEKTFEEWGKGVGNIWKPTASLAKALGENADKIHDLQQEIADLDVVIKNSAEDHAALAKFQEQLKVKTKAATEAIREQAKATQELVVNLLKDQVASGKTLLKEWVHDNSSAIKEVIAGYRKLATEQEHLTKKLKAELKDLIKDREKFDDALQNNIDKIKEQDQKPEEIIKNRIAKGQVLEGRANLAAKIGDRDEVQRLVQEAAGIYESILGVDGANTKENRKTVVDAMQRLKDEMDKVYQAEQDATTKRIAASEAAAKAFTDKANLVEEKFKAFQQGVLDLTRDIEKLSKAPTEEALKALKDRILKLMGDSQFFLTIDEDPALKALDNTIDKVKALKNELATVPDFLLKALGNDEATKQLLLQGTTASPVAPVEPKSTTNNTTNTTNVDMRGTTINAGSGGGPTDLTDGRRLARILKRHIERGEAPALGR